MSLTEAKQYKNVLTQSLLESISDIISSIVAVHARREIFVELGSYIHRTSVVIMELKQAETSESSVIELLKSITTKLDVTKDLVAKCSNGFQTIMNDELRAIIGQLEEVTNGIGQDLSSIPTGFFEKNRYAEISIGSLSKEMKGVRFRLSDSQQYDIDEYKLEIPFETQVMNREEPPLVANSDEDSQGHNSGSTDMPRLAYFLKDIYYGMQQGESQSFNSLPQLAEYVEPLYETFFCPITKKIMEDPVTIESGVTYERRAISEWFDTFKDGSETLTCPQTGMKLHRSVLTSNISLRKTITEWRDRNEATRIRVARTALSLAASEAMVLDAIRDLSLLAKRKSSNKEQMHKIGNTKLLTRIIEHPDITIRCEALQLLSLLVQDEEGKVIIAKTKALKRTVKMLSSNNSSERHASVSFLFELSQSETLLETIGSTAGCILMLVTMKYNESADSFAADKAVKTLKNLEKYSKNIRCMTESGYFEPLLDHLVGGSEEEQMEMLSYLGELFLEDDMKVSVAQRASEPLIKMINSGNDNVRKAAFKVLVQLSSHQPNGKILVDAGIVPILVEEVFINKIYTDMTTDAKEEAAAILANTLEARIDLESIQANKHGHSITSHYFIYNTAHLLKPSSSDVLNISLIKILLSQAKIPKALPTVVSVIKETEGCPTVIEFLNSPREELSIVAARLLVVLSPHMGHTIAEGLCKTKGQPRGLIMDHDTEDITRKRAIFLNLLAKLPHQNLTLNLALLHQGTVRVILSRIQDILRGQARRTRHDRQYLEGLVGVLVRFTTTLFEDEIIQMAMEADLATTLAALLMRTTGSDEVQRMAAVGLQKLSYKTLVLSKPPETRSTKSRNSLLKNFTSQKEGKKARGLQPCPVHRGLCSSKTFCLLETGAVEGLLSCLESESPRVVEAALSALGTLLDEDVDVEQSVRVLCEADGVRRLLRVLREHREEDVWQKLFWVIERFLMKGEEKYKSEIFNDRILPSAVITAFHKGSNDTKQVAESILRYMDKMPQFSARMVS